MSEIQHVLSLQNELGEGPLWNLAEQRLYWVDILGRRVHRLQPASGEHEVFDLGAQVCVIAFRQGGGKVVAGQHGFAFWDEGATSLRPIADPEAHKPTTRFNDGAVDRRGRFWAGTMGDPFNNALYRLDADLSLRTMENGIDISNGIGWSPDNRTMYHTDSTPALIYAYDFDLHSGEIANRRIFVDSSAAERGARRADGGQSGLHLERALGRLAAGPLRPAGQAGAQRAHAGGVPHQRDLRRRRPGRALCHLGARGGARRGSPAAPAGRRPVLPASGGARLARAAVRRVKPSPPEFRSGSPLPLWERGDSNAQLRT